MTSLLARTLMAFLFTTTLAADDLAVGLGRVRTRPADGGEREPPPAHLMAAPVPTNRWFSSAVFQAWPQPLHALPGSYRPTPAGFEIDQPQPRVAWDEAREQNDVVAAHQPTLLVAPADFRAERQQVERASDWAVDLRLSQGERFLRATIGHGSPYAFFTASDRSLLFRSAAPARVFYRSADRRALGIACQDRAFGLYAPLGSAWEIVDDRTLRLTLPDERRFFSVAVLPQAEPAQARRFLAHAFAFVTDTRVDWRYDEARSEVTTTFKAETRAMEGEERRTLFALYPHQWHANPLLADPGEAAYPSIRGPLKLLAGQGFQTRYRYRGLLPHFPALADPAAVDRLKALLEDDGRGGAEALLGNRGTYWQGKGFNRAAQLLPILEHHGDAGLRDRLLAAIERRFEHWFAPAGAGEPYFHYNRAVGSLIGYPDEFGSAQEMNDHHFHYGYWIFAAAQVALRDPAWAARERWGGMVELLARDIATTVADDPQFPRLRNFDPYEGHGWASGVVPFFDGNNQESSSEAIHAWAGLILWGEITGNRQLRDTGIYLYTTEIEAAQHYWFDLHGLVFPRGYGHSTVGILWGSKYVHSTWWTEDPRQVHGINFLPLTTASLYLGERPAHLARNLAALTEESRRYATMTGETTNDGWQDILLSAEALADPAKARAGWNPEGAVEDGETRSHTWFWLSSLAELGRPDFTVTADTPLYGVFANGDRRRYLAYNAGATPREVRFSDGTLLTVPPRSLAQASRDAGR